MERSSTEAARAARIGMFKAFGQVGGGHYGACLSIIDILTQIYFKEMRIDPANPAWEDRDRFVLSKGHAGYGLYAVLAERGYFPPDKLGELRNGVMLPKHADKHRVAGVDVSTGSLGQGLSIAVGMALSAKRSGKSLRVFTIMGDGECNEGQIWEAAMAAAKFKLDNLIGVVDQNRLQVDGCADDIMPLEPLPEKWAAFGWNVERADGHDFGQLAQAFRRARAVAGKPSVIIADTVKGKGISYMENVCEWHGGTCTPEQYAAGLKELEGVC